MLWANLHHWNEMRLLWNQLTGLSKLQTIWRGPDWAPSGEISSIPEVSADKVIKYNSSCTFNWKIYIVVHFATIVIGLRLLSNSVTFLSYKEIGICVVYITWGLTTMTMVLEQNKHVIIVETLRFN